MSNTAAGTLPHSNPPENDPENYTYRKALTAPLVLDVLPSGHTMPAIDSQYVIQLDGTKVENEYAKRPARRQVKKGSGPTREYTHHSSEYNIWYGKKLGDSWEKPPRMKASTRCCIASDAGYTKADKGNKDTYICLYFARGHCSNGPECQYYHRLPNSEDEMRLDSLHDVFGRERHRTYRDDMGGVGSFNRNNHTLYITGLKRQSSSEELIVRHFSEWGKIEYARIIWDKMIAFVRYSWRSSAEFAKEAMIDQSLNDDEVLVIKWAHEDPNPTAQNKEEMRNLLQVAEVVNKKIEEDKPIYPYTDATGAVSLQQFPAQSDSSLYPSTDNQYQASNSYTNNSQAVQDWLEKVAQQTKLKGLESYKDKIIASDYSDLTSLSQLDDIMLDAIGINKEDHRSALIEAAKDLKKDLESQAAQYDPKLYQQWQEYYANYANYYGHEYPGYNEYDQSASYPQQQQAQQQVHTYNGQQLVDYGPPSDEEN